MFDVFNIFENILSCYSKETHVKYTRALGIACHLEVTVKTLEIYVSVNLCNRDHILQLKGVTNLRLFKEILKYIKYIYSFFLLVKRKTYITMRVKQL